MIEVKQIPIIFNVYKQICKYVALYILWYLLLYNINYYVNTEMVIIRFGEIGGCIVYIIWKWLKSVDGNYFSLYSFRNFVSHLKCFDRNIVIILFPLSLVL